MPGRLHHPGRPGLGEFEGVIDLIEMKFVTQRQRPTRRTASSSLVDIPAKYKAEAARVPRAAARRRLARRRRDRRADPRRQAGVRRSCSARRCARARSRASSRPSTAARRRSSTACSCCSTLVVDYLPSPARPAAGRRASHPKTKETVERKPDPKEPFAALAFKTVAESTGDLVYVRIYSGELKPGETYLNTTNGKTERIARFYRMMGDTRQRAGSRPARATSSPSSA